MDSSKVQQERLEIEYVDTIGIPGVLDALTVICLDKAEHLRSNWQDDVAAKDWERVAKILEKARAKVAPWVYA